MEEEAVGRDEVRAARALLGVQAAAGHRAHHQAHPPRQGPPSRLQGQAGVCGLPYPCQAWWQEEASAQGYCLW
ncbi:hypothetical protein ACQJBY_049145 [Aegilops geniculata]